MKFFCLPIFACKGKTDFLDYSCQKLEIIPDAVFKNAKTLEDLNLGVNRILDLPDGFFRMPKLQRLILSYNNIRYIPPGIGDLSNLVELDISNNELCDIPEEIGQCTGLVVLNISNNILTSDNLPNSIVNLSQLTHLVMSKTDIRNLPSDIDKLENLRLLNACECSLKALPANIVKLKYLQHLDVVDNFLAELPSGFGRLESLRELNLDNNVLVYLPDDLLKCSNLEYLIVCRNRITALPSDIGNLTKLIELDAHTNELVEIPTSIRRMTQLQILRLYNNHIDSIPMSIGSLTSLVELYLASNSLSSLPSSIGSLSKLTFLDVAVNFLTEVPSTIGSLNSLGSLLLRGNKIKKLPDEIGKLTRLRVLDVVDNELEDLPYTLVVLKDTLRALYLAADRPVKVSILKESRGKHNIKVLVHYMLPQTNYAPMTDNKSTLGGPRIRWATDVPTTTANVSSEVGFIDESVEEGPLERHDTPHPRNFASKYQQRLQNRKMNEADGQGITMRPLRSVLKNRPNSASSLAGLELPMDVTSIMIRRDENGNLGWSVYGGVDCFPPFKDHDFGFFVSRLEQGGPAEQAGFGVGDKIVAVNGRPLGHCTHDQGVALMTDTGDVVVFDVFVANPELTIPPIVPIIESNIPQVPPSTAIEAISDKTPSSDSNDVIAVAIRCDYTGDIGFTVMTDPISNKICIDNIVSDGPAASSDKLRSGDGILSINGTNVTSMAMGDVEKLLKPTMNDENFEVYLVVERNPLKTAQNEATLAQFTSVPSMFEAEKAESAPIVAPYKKGHARKPSEDFGIGGTPFLVELSREPVRAMSISDMTHAINNDATIVTSANCSLDIEISTEKVSNSSNTTVIFDASKACTSTESAVSVVSKPVPPPIAPKPKFLSEMKQQASGPKLIGIDISSRIRQFEQINTQLASPVRNDMSPPERKPLVTEAEIIQLKLEADKSFVGAAPLASIDDEESVNGNESIAEEYDTMINKMITPTMPKVIRTKKAENRAIAAAAAMGLSPTTSPLPNGLQRSDSALSNGSTVAPLDLNEIEKHRRWREARMNSVELMSKHADDLLNDFRLQMSRLSNISEDHTVPSPIPIK